MGHGIPAIYKVSEHGPFLKRMEKLTVKDGCGRSVVEAGVQVLMLR